MHVRQGLAGSASTGVFLPREKPSVCRVLTQQDPPRHSLLRVGVVSRSAPKAGFAPVLTSSRRSCSSTSTLPGEVRSILPPPSLAHGMRASRVIRAEVASRAAHRQLCWIRDFAGPLFQRLAVLLDMSRPKTKYLSQPPIGKVRNRHFKEWNPGEWAAARFFIEILKIPPRCIHLLINLYPNRNMCKKMIYNFLLFCLHYNQ